MRPTVDPISGMPYLSHVNDIETIAKLRAEIERLTKERDGYRTALIRACEYIDLMHTVLPTSLHKAEAMGECAAIARVIEGKQEA